MLVVVNQPYTEGFRIEGNIPKDVLDYIEKKYSKKDVSVMDDEGDELIDPFEQDFFKDFKSRETPGGNLRFYRKLVGMTQKELAEKLGIAKQHVSNMERNERAISKKIAKELAKIFHVSPARFI